MTKRDLIPLLIANNPAVALAIAQSEYQMNFGNAKQLADYLAERFDAGDVGMVQGFFDQVPYIHKPDSTLGQLVKTATGARKMSIWQILGGVFSGLGDAFTGNVDQPAPPPPPPPPPSFWEKNGKNIMIGLAVVAAGVGLYFAFRKK